MASFRWTTLCLVTIVACNDGAIDPENLSGLTIDGLVETSPGSPIGNATVWLRVWDSSKTITWVDTTILTDGSGRFGGQFPIDTILVVGSFQADATPPFGSGNVAGGTFFPLTFNPAGQADTSGIRITLPRLEPAVPDGPVLPLTAALLEGADYLGRTVHPTPNVGGAYLDLLGLTATGDSVHGRYAIDFDASTACGNGNGDARGRVVNDTLYFRLVSDSFPGWDGILKVNSFTATTYTPTADTLIVRHEIPTGSCPWGAPAPLRLVR